MREWEFVIDGEPVAKARPRVNTKTGSVYTPAATVDAEHKVAQSVKYQAVGKADLPISTGLIAVETEFWSTRDPKKPRGRTDIDNLLKLVLDALNGVFWDDDWRVVEVSASLTREVPKDEARTVIRILHNPEE